MRTNPSPGPPVAFLFVVSEETTHQGMKAANALNLKPNWMIVGEPTAAKVLSECYRFDWFDWN
jgi:hypothetical protein